MVTGQPKAAAVGEARDVQISTADGHRLRGRWWRKAEARGILVIAHGFGEHSGTYRNTAVSLGSALELDVVAFDLRGHGRSTGRRGFVRRYEELTDDLSSAVDWAVRNRPGVPCFLLGHSNGGQVALRVALQARSPVDGLIVSNPALRIIEAVPPHKLRLGRFLRRYAPWVTLRAPLRADRLTRDPVIQGQMQSDRLRHNRMSAPLFFGMVEGGEILIARADEIRLPTLMLVGGQDPIVDPSAAREFYDRLGSEDKTLLLYPRMLHEPLNEVGREQVLQDVSRWIHPRLNGR